MVLDTFAVDSIMQLAEYVIIVEITVKSNRVAKVSSIRCLIAAPFQISVVRNSFLLYLRRPGLISGQQQNPHLTFDFLVVIDHTWCKKLFLFKSLVIH